jgi:colanic acid biosynthesis glycosyl transferase WcaI
VVNEDMKILLLTMYFAPDVAANAVIMTELAEELADLGHQVTVVTAFPHYQGNVTPEEYRGKLIQREKRSGIGIIRTYLYTAPDKSSMLVRFLNYVSFNVLSTLAGIFSGKQDLILAPSPPLTIGLSAAMIGFFKRIPYVFNVQDINPDVLINLGILKNTLAIRFSKALEKFVYRHSRHLTVLSEGFKKNLMGKGVPAEKITIIPNFIDLNFMQENIQSEEFLKSHGIHGKQIVLYAGNMGHSLHIDRILDAAQFFQDNPDVMFLAVGDGSCGPLFRKKVEELGLENFKFLPFQPREKVPSIYHSADLSLVPLKAGVSKDSVPSKIYTIMASARPVIGLLDVNSDAWNLVERSGSGFLAAPDDPDLFIQAIQAVLEDPDLGDQLGQNGLDYVRKHHTRERVGIMYHNLFQDILAYGEDKKQPNQEGGG